MFVILINHGADSFAVTRGMRIAQLVIAPVAAAQIREVAKLGKTTRGGSGFGSTDSKTGISEEQLDRPRNNILPL